MSAPNIPTLYDFESVYEDALVGYFTNANIGFVQILTPRSNINDAQYLKTPRLQIRCGTTGVLADGSGLKEDTTSGGNNYLSYYGVMISLDVITQRSNVSQKHGLMRGATRQGMLELTQALNNVSVPYYQTVQMTPQPSTQAIDPANDEIQTQLGFLAEVFIPPASFPNGY